MPDPGYVRIKRNYRLRGWRDRPFTLVECGSGKQYLMGEGVFRTLQLCNGSLPADSPIFMGKRQMIVSELGKRGFLELVHEPSPLLPEQEYRYFDNNYLMRVHWSLTGHCNYRCRHCYMSAPHALLPQPSTEECLAIVDQIADCGIPRVSLTGGEPLIRKDFLRIVDRLIERDIRIDVIMTNGSLVDGELLDAFDERGIRPEFNMSFDGPERWHDWIRGVDGAYGSVRRALALCHDRGFVTGVELVLHKGNVSALRESVNELASLGVSALKVNGLACVGEGEAISGYALSDEELLETFLEYIPHFFEDGAPLPKLQLSGFFSYFEGRITLGGERNPDGEDHGSAPICGSALSTMYLGSDGRIWPCVGMSERGFMAELFPTLEGMTLKEALNDPFYVGFITRTLDNYLDCNPACRVCGYKNRCGGGCRASAIAANKGADLMAVDPKTCIVFKGGYYDRLRELVGRLSR